MFPGCRLTGLLVTAMSLMQGSVSVHAVHVEPPGHPVNTIAAGLVVTEVEIVRLSGRAQMRLLSGEPPFAAFALEALKHWRFAVAPDGDIGRTSVTFLFRPPTIYPGNIHAMTTWPWNLDQDFPALPQHVIDPGYPPTSLATGAAILQVQVSASGVVLGTKAIGGVHPLTDKAEEAVRKWRFSPARVSGKAAPGTVFVVISFVLPA